MEKEKNVSEKSRKPWYSRNPCDDFLGKEIKSMFDEMRRIFPNLHIFLFTLSSNKNWQARRQILAGCSIQFIEASNVSYNSLIFTRFDRKS